ncbi:hypothetical protein FIM04_02360 [SAR202 cluster bacterium AC-409-J13_OGT_754m]|nr:hypothetical protein [SAR202 cluster bacterium AC-409-J13_OGT_754m]
MIYGVIGVTIWTSNIDNMLPFYRDIMKLPLHSNHGDFVAFKFKGFRLNLGLHDKVNGPNSDPFRIMINLGVTDISEEYSRLSKKGVVFMRIPEKEDWGGWVSTFCDPDGNILQLIQI